MKANKVGEYHIPKKAMSSLYFHKSSPKNLKKKLISQLILLYEA